MRLGFIAHEVHRRGGMERAAAEVLTRVATVRDVVVIAKICEITAARLTWLPVRSLAAPGPLGHASFARKARAAELASQCTLTHTIGADAADADVVTAQFCFAAFSHKCGAVRGGRNPLRRIIQGGFQRVSTWRERTTYTSPRLKRVIAVSRGIKRELMEYYGVPDDCISVIPNGVDHKVFRPVASHEAKRCLRARLGLPMDSFIALFVGGDWHRKGVPDAINAVAGLRDTILVVLGRGRVEEFREIAARAGGERQVVFVAPSPSPQDYYAAADAFVFPSRYEAFALTTLEASASGLPILTLPINGTEELIEDGVNGYFVEARPDSIAEKLTTLRDDAACLRVMSAAAITRSQRYSWDRIAAEHLQLFDSVAERRD